MTATTRYISTIDKAVATIESRRNRSDSGTLMFSVDRLLPRGSTNRPTAPAAMYPAVPKCPIAIESSPEMRRDQGWRSEEHTYELQARGHLVCRLLLEKKKDQQ